jgi:hypothetical protein
MPASRIKDASLATGIDESQLAWQRYVSPITEAYCRQVAERDYGGKKLACWQHITLNTIPMLLARGSLLSLAAGAGPHGNDLFDHYTAVMLLGLAWMFEGLSGDIQPGLQRYPAHLEREIAERSIQIHHQA